MTTNRLANQKYSFICFVVVVVGIPLIQELQYYDLCLLCFMHRSKQLPILFNLILKATQYIRFSYYSHVIHEKTDGESDQITNTRPYS